MRLEIEMISTNGTAILLIFLIGLIDASYQDSAINLMINIGKTILDRRLRFFTFATADFTDCDGFHGITSIVPS